MPVCMNFLCAVMDYCDSSFGGTDTAKCDGYYMIHILITGLLIMMVGLLIARQTILFKKLAHVTYLPALFINYSHIRRIIKMLCMFGALVALWGSLFPGRKVEKYTSCFTQPGA